MRRRTVVSTILLATSMAGTLASAAVGQTRAPQEGARTGYRLIGLTPTLGHERMSSSHYTLISTLDVAAAGPARSRHFMLLPAVGATVTMAIEHREGRGPIVLLVGALGPGAGEARKPSPRRGTASPTLP